MPITSRLDLDGLRKLSSAPDHSERLTENVTRLVSRREFLALSSAGVTLVPAVLRGEEFSVVRDGARVHILVRDEPRWTIDPAVFGSNKSVGIARTSDEVRIELAEGRFPGTVLPAAFECVLARRSGIWSLHLDLACGVSVDADLLRWLNRHEPAEGFFGTSALRPCEGFNVAFRRLPAVSFLPDWTVEFAAPAAVTIDGIPDELDTLRCRMLVDSISRIASERSAHTTSFCIPRGASSWSVDLCQNSEHGWSLEHDASESLFDALTVEAAQTGDTVLHSAAFVQNQERASSLRFFTGGGFSGDSGEQFHLSLDKPRLAFTLNEVRRSSALIADLSARPTWAHASDVSFLFAQSSDAPRFELLQDGSEGAAPQVSPGLHEISFPDDDTFTNLKFGTPRPVPLTWADLAAPFERLFGLLHLLPSQHSFDFGLAKGDRLQIDRPRDLLSLGFEFHDMRLITGGNPRVVPKGKNASPQITVVLPPQHIAEEAFFNTTDTSLKFDVPVGDEELRNALGLSQTAVLTSGQRTAGKSKLDSDFTPGGNSSEPDKPQPDTRISGETRLVFKPAAGSEIPFRLISLLDWSQWEPVVAAVAHTGVDQTNVETLPDIVQPQDVTAIELPYSLILSPSELGRWAHSPAPAFQNTEIVELWHTRLGVVARQGQTATQPSGPQPPRSLVDEKNDKDRIARAIWSPDFLKVDPLLCPSDPGPSPPSFPGHFPPRNAGTPFRMSLDSSDRNELVHLTSNYRIPAIDTFCNGGSVLKNPLVPPNPISVELLMLTSMGGYLKSLGAWNPGKIDRDYELTVEQWRHIATLGRDQYVRVVYKGYLLPFGHRASLVKVTERRLVPAARPSDGVVAILHQRMYIVIQAPRRDYPLLGQPNNGRRFPFRRVDALTLVTPDVDPPEENSWPTDPTKQQSQSLFWPFVSGKPFFFRFRFYDAAGQTSEASLPVVFADARVAQDDAAINNNQPGVYNSIDATTLYNLGSPSPPVDNPWTSTPFNGQKVGFAASLKPGDTQYDTSVLAFRADPLAPKGSPDYIDPLQLYRHDLPYFFPSMDFARISSSSIKQITGNLDATRVVFFPTYLTDGFDLKTNRGEVILQVDDDTPLVLAFGATKQVDKAGGLASPDATIVGFARPSGPVGGKHKLPDHAGAAARVAAKNPTGVVTNTSLSTFSSGQFNPDEFFGGLASSKILGAIKLSDIIAQLAPGLASNLEKAPQMLQQTLFAAEGGLESVIAKINYFQGLTISGQPNPIARHLAPLAQAIASTSDAVTAAHQRSANETDPIQKTIDLAQEATLDGQLTGSVLDYANSFEALLRNPADLAQEAVIDILTPIIGKYEQQLLSRFKDLATALEAGLDTAIAAVVGKLQTLLTVANAELQDTITNAIQNIVTATQRFADFAPELNALCDLIATAQDLRSRVSSFATASASFATISDIPARLDDLNGILDDLLQIYQRAGVLGLVTVSPAVVQAVTTTENAIGTAWLQIQYLDANLKAGIDQTITNLEDDCIQAAAAVEAAIAKQLLQNLRQLQASAQSITTCANAIANLRRPATGKEIRREVQLIQRMQGQILGALAAIADIQLPSGLAPLSASIATRVQTLTPALTVANTLVTSGNPIQAVIDAALANPVVASALAAHTAEVRAQIATIRAHLASTPDDIGLKLLCYNATLELQTSLAAIFTLTLYDVVDAAASDAEKAVKGALDGLTALNGAGTNVLSVFAGTIQTLAGSLAAGICALHDDWTAFRTAVHTASTAAEQIFAPSLSSVDDAFNDLCGPSGTGPVEPNPSQVLYKAHALVSAVVALINDVRSRSGVLGAVVQGLVDEAESILPSLLLPFAVPTSISLSYDWHPTIKSFEPVFLLDDGADFIVSATANVALSGGSPTFDITATLSNCSINLIGSPSFVIVDIESLTFTSHNGNKPDCRLKIKAVTFGDAMSFVKELADALNPSEGPFIELADAAIKAGFRFSVPTITSGAFNMMQLAIEAAVALPFDGDPVRCEFSLSDQQNPFLLSAGIYGGGGFLQVHLGLDGVQLLQGALEFGIVAVISIGPLQGEGFVVAGIYFSISGSSSCVCGFVHAHGHVDVFGLITLDVDLYVSICYDSGNVTGTATFTVQVSILFFSESFSLSATYTFAGSDSSQSRASMRSFQQTGVNLDAPSRRSLSQPAVKPEAAPLFVPQPVWTEYFDAFAA